MKLSFSFIFSLIFTNIAFGVEFNSKCNINLYNKNSFQIFYIQEGKDYIYKDKIGLDSNVLNYNVNEPKRAFGYINNDLDHLLVFYIHKGHFSVNIDVENKKWIFKDSPLNNEKMKLVRMEDSLRAIYHIPTPGILRNLIISGINQDSIDNVYEKYDLIRSKMYYNFFTKNNKSFLCLEFIKLHLIIHDFSIRKLKILFSKLPYTFKKYPTYKECEVLFKQQKSPPVKNETVKPIWENK